VPKVHEVLKVHEVRTCVVSGFSRTSKSCNTENTGTNGGSRRNLSIINSGVAVALAIFPLCPLCLIFCDRPFSISDRWPRVVSGFSRTSFTSESQHRVHTAGA
jgi:hypothetical protein